MSLFILAFFSLYSLVHMYVFIKARAAFAFDTKAAVGIIFFMMTMVVAPLIVRISENNGFDRSARLLAYIGYTWLGCVFLFFSASVVLDLYQVLLYLGGLISHKDLGTFSISIRNSFMIPLVLSLLISLYGFFEAQGIQTETMVLRSLKIPQHIARLRIVQISDVHLGLIVRQRRLKRILEEVKKADPDILVSTGDLVDGEVSNLQGLSELLNKIHPRYGKFAVTGNHEFYAGISQSLRFTEKAGFTVLRGEGVTVEDIITIAGVDDPTAKYAGSDATISEKALLTRFPREMFTLLLKHRPLVDQGATGLFDLQLSGHVHNGQIFPFGLFERIYYPHIAGLAKTHNHSYLYVSRGSGTWGPPIRFLAPPEVTVIDLVCR